MKVNADVTVNLTPMLTYRREIPQRNQAVYAKWVVRYRSYIQRRWNIYSRGGGDWPALKYRQGSILRDTNTMFAAMTPTLNAPSGSINEFLNDGTGVVVGFGGSANHPGGPTIEQIALWHQTGAGTLPKREIIVLPDENTLAGMRKDMKEAHPNANTV